MLRWRRKLKSVGGRGEDLAAKALKRAGYTILERNAQLGRYEIDIIACEGDTIAFVEVKTRTEGGFADPEDSVTFTKRRHLSRAGHMYIARAETDDVHYRFDVVSVVLPERGKPDITIYRNAFEAQ